MLMDMSIEMEEPEPLPPFSIHEGMTEFYKDVRDRELEHRQRVAEAISWLRPIDRLFKIRDLSRTDAKIERFTEIIKASEQIDTRFAALATYETEQTLGADLVLDNNTAPQDELAVIQDS